MRAAERAKVRPPDRRLFRRLLKVHVIAIAITVPVAVWLSFHAQGGGITPPVAALTPALGPWSFLLPPNVRSLEKCAPLGLGATAPLVLGLVLAYRREEPGWRIVAAVLTASSSVFWMLCAIGKVLYSSA